MAGWLRRWLGSSPSSSGLSTLLAEYPPYAVPHPGPARELTVAQCRANLDYLLDQREQRLTGLAALVGTFGIDLRAGLGAADPAALLDALEQWARAEWPRIRIDGIGDPERWQRSDKAGADIALSMVMDVAIVLGEIVVRRRADFAWQLDLDPANKRMQSYRRVVVMKPADAAASWAATVLDFERECIDSFDQLGRGGLRDRALGYTVLAATAGGCDPVPTHAADGARPTRPGVYDKAGDHDETVREYGLPERQAAVPGAFFLGWLIERDLCSLAFAAREATLIAAYRQRAATAPEIYDRADRCLRADMLSEEANAFAQDYFADAGKAFWDDCAQVLASGLPSPFHVAYDAEHQQRINARLDERYAAWRKAQRRDAPRLPG